jgi:antitoxin component YwqK of YwqJK toxin-antitoxin module
MKNFKFNGIYEGINIEYFESGNSNSKCYYKNGKIKGEFIKYFNNNNYIWSKCHYKMAKEKGNIFYIGIMVIFIINVIIKMTILKEKV